MKMVLILISMLLILSSVAFARSYDELSVYVKDESSFKAIIDAKVVVYNSDDYVEYTNVNGRAYFDSLERDCYMVDVYKEGYYRERENVCLNEDQSVTIYLEKQNRRYNDLIIYVKDADNLDLIENARVEIDNSERDVDYTNDFGRVKFYDVEKDCYSVKVSKKNYETSYEDFCVTDESEAFTVYLNYDKDYEEWDHDYPYYRYTGYDDERYYDGRRYYYQDYYDRYYYEDDNQVIIDTQPSHRTYKRYVEYYPYRYVRDGAKKIKILIKI